MSEGRKYKERQIDRALARVLPRFAEEFLEVLEEERRSDLRCTVRVNDHVRIVDCHEFPESPEATVVTPPRHLDGGWVAAVPHTTDPRLRNVRTFPPGTLEKSGVRVSGYHSSVLQPGGTR